MAVKPKKNIKSHFTGGGLFFLAGPAHVITSAESMKKQCLRVRYRDDTDDPTTSVRSPTSYSQQSLLFAGTACSNWIELSWAEFLFSNCRLCACTHTHAWEKQQRSSRAKSGFGPKFLEVMDTGALAVVHSTHVMLLLPVGRFVCG